DHPGSSPPVMKDRCAPRPAPIRQVRAGARLWDVPTPVPRVLLSATLAGHTPSGGTDPPRLCQGCSRPPRHHPGQAALSFSGPLPRTVGAGLSPPLELPALFTAHVNDLAICILPPLLPSSSLLGNQLHTRASR